MLVLQQALQVLLQHTLVVVVDQETAQAVLVVLVEVALVRVVQLLQQLVELQI